MFEIKKIPKLLKNFLAISILLPFWYVAIYLFSTDFNMKTDLILTISLCICLSVISSIIMSIPFVTDNEKVLDFGVIIPSIILNILILSMLIFIGYASIEIFEKTFNFYGFLCAYFPIIITTSGLLMSRESKKDKKAKQKKR